MKKLVFFLCLMAPSAFSETPKIDSLKRELERLDKQPNSYTNDTLRYQALKAIMRGYVDVNIDSSFHYKNQLTKLCIEKKLKKEILYAYYYTGFLYQVQGKYFECIQSYYKTLLLAEKQKQYIDVAALCRALAHAYSSLENNSDALKLCQKGLAVLNAHPDPKAYEERLSLLNVKGVIYRKQNKLVDALKVNQEMYNLARSKPYDQWYEAHGLHAIGLVYKEMDSIPKAFAYHKKALLLSRKTGSVELQGYILINLADLYIRQKSWQRAFVYCNQAKQMAQRVKNSGLVAKVYEKLYTVYKNTGDSRKALKAHETFMFLKDSLLKEKNLQRFEALQSQYKNEKKTNLLQQRLQLMAKQHENERLAQTRNGLLIGIIVILVIATLLVWNNTRLQAKNRELVRKNEEIKEARFEGQTIERKRVALELHDNLSSLLSAVSISVQSINSRNLSDSEQIIYRNVNQLIQDAYTEVRNISHNILPAEFEREGLSVALTKLVHQFNQNLPLRLSLRMTGLQERLPLEIEFNVYSIIRELINNAVKHAQATLLEITLVRTEYGVNLSVMDNGIGLTQHHQKQGVGLQNIQTRLDALGGTFRTLLPNGKGTHINIKIPIETVRINGNPGLTEQVSKMID